MLTKIIELHLHKNPPKMTFQNLTNYSKIIRLFILLTFLSQLSSAWKTTELSKWDKKQQQLAAVDAISLSIQQVQGARKFIETIPHLQSVLASIPSAGHLFKCVDDLIVKSNEIEKALLKLRLLLAPGLVDDAHSLWLKTLRALISSVLCRKAFSEFDGVMATVVSENLKNLVLIVEDVVNCISELENGRLPAASKAGKNP